MVVNLNEDTPTITPSWTKEPLLSGERLKNVAFTDDCKQSVQEPLVFNPPSAQNVSLNRVFRYTFENLGYSQDFEICNITDPVNCTVPENDRKSIQCVFKEFSDFGSYPM